MKRFMEAIEEEEIRQQEQERLHAKHNIEDENIVIVEKSNMIKFSVKSIASLIRAGATIILLCLAAIGLLCIIYPETRQAFQEVMQQLINQLSCFF